MPVATILYLDETSTDVYDSALTEMGWPDEVPDKPISQTVGSVNGGLWIIGIWESRAKFDAYVTDWLWPALAEFGGPVHEEPKVDELDIHQLWPE